MQDISGLKKKKACRYIAYTVQKRKFKDIMNTSFHLLKFLGYFQSYEFTYKKYFFFENTCSNGIHYVKNKQNTGNLIDICKQNKHTSSSIHFMMLR